MNVLIVSRKQSARDHLRSTLGPGWEVAEAENGLVALALARDEDVDLVIADETTEPYGAFGLSRELKLFTDAPAVLILLERGQDTWLAAWSGADRWLLQPADPFEVAETARALVAERNGGIPDDGGTEGDVPADESEPVAG